MKLPDVVNATIPTPPPRLVSLDAYRGAIMLSLISVGLGFGVFEGDPLLGGLANQLEHVQWEGFVYWDLIQPAFMFMVGVAMPLAFARRISLGDSMGRIYQHALIRAFNLLLIAAIFTSIHQGHPAFTLVNVLPQIAFGYLATLPLVNKGYLLQGITALTILTAYSFAWIIYPGNGSGGPWAMSNANLGGDFERWIMGQHNQGYWVSLNAIPSTATIIVGVMCGKLLASEHSAGKKITLLVLGAVSLILAGWFLRLEIPIIKRILTASFALYSTGWAILLLAIFYWIIDVLSWKRWSLFLVVVGMNSIAAYVVFQLFRGWIDRSILIFSGPAVEALGNWGSVLQATLVLAAQWWLFYVLYQKRTFFKV